MVRMHNFFFNEFLPERNAHLLCRGWLGHIRRGGNKNVSGVSVLLFCISMFVFASLKKRNQMAVCILCT